MKLLRKIQQDKLDDQELWMKVIQKDRCALEVLYKRYFSTLYHYGLRFTSDEELVKDAVQELFVYLLSGPNLNKVVSVRAYLMIALRNNVFKIKSQKQMVSLDEISFEWLITDDDLGIAFPKDDDALLVAKQLRRAYQSLNNNQRHIIYLYYIKNFSWEEIAVLLKISPHSCMNLLRRAVKKLHSILTEEEVILGKRVSI